MTAILRKRRWEAGFILLLALAAAFIVQKFAGTYPVVFADEMHYSRLARLVPLPEVTIPSYLYLLAFRVTSMCGDGFLDCARYLNLLFLVAAAPLIYLTARDICGKPLAMAVALLCLIAPAHIYSAYFMPESMYFFGFAALSWVVLQRGALGWPAHAALAGAILGLMTLVKVHALFLAPALAGYLLYAGWRRQRGQPWMLRALGAAGLAMLAMLAVKLGLGYLFAGENGLHLLGAFYGTQANDGLRASALATLFDLMPGILLSLKGHLLLLAIVFPLPLAAIALVLLRPRVTARANPKLLALVVYTVLMTGAALALAVAYTGSTDSYGPHEGLRLHVRYYNFCFPLLLMAAAAATGGAPAIRWSPLRATIALVLGCALMAAAELLPASYRLLLVDAPEIVTLGLGAADSLAPVILWLQAAVLLVWALDPRRGAQLFLLAVLPLCAWNAEQVGAPDLARTRLPSAFDNAGRFARAYLGADRNNVTIAGTNLGELQRAKFHLDAADTDLVDLPEGWALRPEQMPGRDRSLLLIGSHALPPGSKPLVQTAEYALFAPGPESVSLGLVQLNGALAGTLLADVQGLYGAEPWGRWSSGKQVHLHFRAALPKHLHLSLKARAFGPNAEQDFVARVGQAQARFRVMQGSDEVFLQMETDGQTRTLTIDVPQPVSPAQLGMSGDTRLLGIGVTSVEIGRATAK